MSFSLRKLLPVLMAIAAVCAAQSAAAPQSMPVSPPGAPQRLTLADARALAIKNHPRLAAANYTAAAVQQQVTETRSAYYPTVTANITAADSLDNSRIAAGALNNPTVFSRAAGGVQALQLLSDFGRTGNLTASARFNALAEQQSTQYTRAGILLGVDQAFYALLRSREVLRVAKETVSARQGVQEQIQTLFNNKLRSSLDVSFANVAVSEAQLLLISAQNDEQATEAALSNALGFRDLQPIEPVVTDMPEPLSETPQPFLNASLRDRSDLLSLRARRDAANRYAEAEKDLSRPTISAIGTVGGTPVHDDRMTSKYAAAGVNVSIPIFNGRLFTARHEEAELRAQAVDQTVRDLEDRVTRDVRVAWLDARTGLQRIQTTNALLAQANESLDLAQSRYNLGLSTIVELNQALLNKTSAEIAVASARFDYQLERTVLEFQTGTLK